ncbi:helix-turn-helix transcriptional regulator [Ferrovum myxofaciens]|uniref:helix-turn-helix transcriptional regulator n=1 Tax=Ferrovum myxofaciens TaxID=416213 RepID=UPI0023553CE5|nr:AlpA family phage regulatory protein [Ferrovum myxofaciens]MBU6994034.1 AlpA family phage regulatory protein [Ferrovum myxofaciens]
MSEINYQNLPNEARLRMRQVQPVVGLAVSTIWRNTANGTFPKPTKHGAVTTWSWGQIKAYLAGIEEAR